MSGSVNVQNLESKLRPTSKRSNQILAKSQVELNQEIIEELSYGLVIRHDSSFGSLVRPSNTQEPIQRWFQYREGYTVELCKRLFSDNESFVLDPFCGFGSTLVAARCSGIPSAGLDVNPLAAFVSRVKTRSYSPPLIRELNACLKKLKSLTELDKAAKPPQIRILEKLFHPEILKALLIFQAEIESMENQNSKDFFYFAWIAILEKVSNVYREGNGVKYRNRIRRGNVYSVTPYDDWQAKYFPEDKFDFIRNELLSQISMMLKDIDILSDGMKPSIAQEDASRSSLITPSEGASLILFSPPYCNCFNYIKAYKLELWMAGFIKSYPDIKKLTALGIRSRTESLRSAVTEPYPIVIEKFIELMDFSQLWHQQLPEVVRGYFADMQRVLASLINSLKVGGRCIIIVGNSAYTGILIPSDLLLAHIAELVGFEVEEILVARHLTTSSQQKKQLEPIKQFLRESIICLRRVR